MVLLAANNRRRRFSWLKATFLMVAKAPKTTFFMAQKRQFSWSSRRHPTGRCRQSRLDGRDEQIAQYNPRQPSRLAERDQFSWWQSIHVFHGSKTTFLIVAKATFLIEPLVAARMALEWIQRHGSCPPTIPAKPLIGPCFPELKEQKRRFPWLKATIFMVARAQWCKVSK